MDWSYSSGTRWIGHILLTLTNCFQLQSHCSTFGAGILLTEGLIPNSRFAQTQDIDVLLEDTNTKRVINVAKRLLDAFCSETGHCYDGLNKRELDMLLHQFYAGMRSKKGEEYCKRSMITMRYGIQKYFIKTCEIDMVKAGERGSCSQRTP